MVKSRDSRAELPGFEPMSVIYIVCDSISASVKWNDDSCHLIDCEIYELIHKALHQCLTYMGFPGASNG